MLLVIVSYAFYAFGMALICCELGERFSNCYSEIPEKICQFEWYLFTPELQKILPIMMIVAQQPVEIECFGSISCSRETFKKVQFANELFRQIGLKIIMKLLSF